MRFLFLICVFLIQTQAFSAKKDLPTWKEVDDPDSFIGYTQRNFLKLPSAKTLSPAPWTDTYWPTYKGGISHRWARKGNEKDTIGYKLLTKEDVEKLTPEELKTLSPSEKFDLIQGDFEWSLTKYERGRTQILKTIKGQPEYDAKFKIPTWEGICHNWSPSALLYDEPDPKAIRSEALGKDIEFGSSDLKALIMINMEIASQMEQIPTPFFGSRCELEIPKALKALSLGLITPEIYFKMVRKQNCLEVNAAAFHLAITNLIGLQNEGFVFDRTTSAQVWNQPVYGYKFEYKLLKDFPVKNNSKYFLEPAKIYGVKMILQWVSEEGPRFTKVTGKDFLRETVYDYKISVNYLGEIIAGEWEKGATTQPDFLWRMAKPHWHPSFSIIAANIGDNGLKGNMSGGMKRRSDQELKELFRSTSKNILNSIKFINRSKNFIKEKKANSDNYYKEIKNLYINDYKKLMEKVQAKKN